MGSSPVTSTTKRQCVAAHCLFVCRDGADPRQDRAPENRSEPASEIFGKRRRRRRSRALRHSRKAGRQGARRRGFKSRHLDHKTDGTFTVPSVFVFAVTGRRNPRQNRAPENRSAARFLGKGGAAAKAEPCGAAARRADKARADAGSSPVTGKARIRAHLAPFLPVSGFGHLRFGKLPRPRTRKYAICNPSTRFALYILLPTTKQGSRKSQRSEIFGKRRRRRKSRALRRSRKAGRQGARRRGFKSRHLDHKTGLTHDKTGFPKIAAQRDFWEKEAPPGGSRPV